jgi:DNA end-binding protein Ku
MAARTSWEGYLKLNLLSVPVKAYNAAAGGGNKVGFHLIHEECYNRIQYRKVCPVHGEVPNDEIISAYEVAKGTYVPVEAEERRTLRPEDEKAITIDTFIRPDDLDPIYYGDRSYYLVPDGKVAQKPYAVVQEVMTERGRYAVAQVVMSGRGHVVLLRPVAGLLVMTLLNYDADVKKSSEFEDDVPDVAVSPKERELARDLVDASTADRFDFSGYKERRGDEPVVVNLMDALRQSLARTKRGTAAKTPAPQPAARARKGRGGPAPRRSTSKRKTG